MSTNPLTTHRQPGSGTAIPTATTGSQTLLQTQEQTGPSIPIPALRLRATQEPRRRQRIQWAEDVVDNEGMGKKSSKVCCIYHKPHEPGDSSSESDESDSDEEGDLSKARRAGGRGKGRRREGEGKGKGDDRKASPNAYERLPKGKSKQEG